MLLYKYIFSASPYCEIGLFINCIFSHTLRHTIPESNNCGDTLEDISVIVNVRSVSPKEHFMVIISDCRKLKHSYELKNYISKFLFYPENLKLSIRKLSITIRKSTLLCFVVTIVM